LVVVMVMAMAMVMKTQKNKKQSRHSPEDGSLNNQTKVPDLVVLQDENRSHTLMGDGGCGDDDDDNNGR